MNKALEFFKNEKDVWGGVYVNITNAVNDISPFLDKNTLNLRKYVNDVSILKKYFQLIEAGESEISNGGFFSKLKDGDKYVSLIESYKRDNSEEFNQLRNCNKCACLKCVSECKFDSCLGCRKGSHIKSCDHRKINVTFHDNYVIELTNNSTGITDKYLVLATLQYVELDRKYIIIEGLKDNEKFVLYYYPGTSEDSFGEITDANEMDFVVSTFLSVEK